MLHNAAAGLKISWKSQTIYWAWKKEPATKFFKATYILQIKNGTLGFPSCNSFLTSERKKKKSPAKYQ